MITIRPGSHVHTLLVLLSFVGEFPMSSLHLLGSVRSYKDLIRKLNQEQEFRFHDTVFRMTCRLLTFIRALYRFCKTLMEGHISIIWMRFGITAFRKSESRGP